MAVRLAELALPGVSHEFGRRRLASVGLCLSPLSRSQFENHARLIFLTVDFPRPLTSTTESTTDHASTTFYERVVADSRRVILG